MNVTARLGRVYRCPVCGAEVLVIRAATRALDLHCCNVPMEPLERLLPVYRCPHCGAEVAAVRETSGPLELICCGRPMERRECPVPEAA